MIGSPTAAEIPAIRGAFDKFFDVIETKETDSGNVVLFSRTQPRIPFIAQQDEGYVSVLNKVIALFKSGDRAKQQEAGKTPVPISRTPVVLRQVIEDDGSKPFKRSDFVVGQGSTLFLKADNVHSRSIHSGRISKEVLEKLPQLLADPVAVFKSSPASDDSKSFKVLLDAVDENGDPVIVAIKPNVPMQQLNNAPVNFQATIFPAKWDKVREWNKDGLLRYYNEKSPRISVAASNPREAATEVDTQEGFDANIGASSSKVKVVTKGDIEKMPESAFSRNQARTSGLPKAKVQAFINNITKQWKNAPQIVVVDDMNDPAIREAVRAENERQLSQGAEGQPEGFFDDGKVYLIASEMNSANDVVRVLFHETLGHYGLRGLYGKDLARILDQVAMLRKSDMKAKAKQYGLDLSKTSDLRIVAEEILAEMAQTAPGSSMVKSAIAAIRKFLRDIGFDIALSDNDIIEGYLIPARNFVLKEANANQGGKALSAMKFAFSISQPTKIDYEKRIDELFDGKPANKIGATVLDKSDMLDMLGYGDKPIVLVESKVIAGQSNHELNAGHWKKIPEWLENPAAVFDSDSVKGSLVFIAPELYKGSPIRMIVEPNVKDIKVNLLINAYDAQGKNPTSRWVRDGLMRYIDKAKSREFLNAARLQLPSTLKEARDQGRRLLVDSDLVKYRANNPANLSRSTSQAPLTPTWKAPDATKMDNLVYALQDKYVDLKRVSQAIKDTGTEIADRWNAYLQEELYHGRTAKRTQDFIKQDLDPLIQDMRMRGVKMADFEEYLWARHAE